MLSVVLLKLISFFREREREREKERERETDRQTDGRTDRQTERKREKKREREDITGKSFFRSSYSLVSPLL